MRPIISFTYIWIFCNALNNDLFPILLLQKLRYMNMWRYCWLDLGVNVDVRLILACSVTNIWPFCGLFYE